jgi:dTDP-4-amino-4,6-dideoxygalactose transaminase
MKVPFNQLVPGEDAAAVHAAVQRVIASGWFVLGPEVEAFETEFAAAARASHCVGVANGTDAIALALRALGIGPGDEVITPPLSAAFSALGVMMSGARPVFADIDPDRLTLSPEAAAAAITPRTGQAADMPPIAAIARRHGLAIVEDACQAHLGTCGGQPVGSFGIAAAYSFYPTKNLGALGDGGAVTTPDPAIAERLKRLRNGGQASRYRHVEAGVNSRLDEMQAAILRARLPYLAAWTARRREIATMYRDGLRRACCTVPGEHDAGHVYHLFPVLSTRRDDLQKHLTAAGVETLIHYPTSIARQPAVEATAPAPCPNADRACAELLSLPMYPSLAAAAVTRVLEAAISFGS